MTLRRFAAGALLTALAASALAAPSPRYAPVLAELKARTRLPVLLPAWLPPDAAGRFPQASADAHSYAVDLAFAPDCSGAQACTGLSVSAEDAVAAARSARGMGETTARYLRRTYRSGRRVPLKHGVVGWYTAPGPSADGGSTTLAWRYKNAFYSLQLRSLIPAPVMARCAASALP